MRNTLVGLGLSLLLIQGCGDEPHAPEPVLSLSPAPIADGEGQSWSTGHTLPDPLRVRVTKDGVPVIGVGVLWVPDSGNGRMSPPASLTDAQGIAISRWTLSTRAGDHRARALIAEDTALAVTFTATAYPNFPHQIHLLGGDDQSAPAGGVLAEPLIVRVGDQFNNDFPGASVEWVVVSGEASVTPAISTTDQVGHTQTVVTMGSQPGPVEVLARFPGAQTGPMVVFHLLATP